jgi:hypothetical protein
MIYLMQHAVVTQGGRMDTPDAILETIDRIQCLRSEAQHLWRQTQSAGQEQTVDPQPYAELMLQQQQLLIELRHALVEFTGSTQE